MKYFKILLAILIFCFGLVIGMVFHDFPKLKLNTEIKLFEPLTFLLTATIGVLLPFFIKRWIEDSRHIKNNLIDELKSTLKEVEIIKEKIKFCYDHKTINSSDKAEIICLFENADIKCHCLIEQLLLAYKNETKLIRDEINLEYLTYWKFTTGAEIMSQNFITVNYNYYKRHNDCFSSFEMIVKKAIIKIHKL